MPEETTEISPYRLLHPSPEQDAALAALAVAPAGPDEDRFHLRESWRVLVKHRSVVFGILLCSILATTLLTLTMPLQFTAVATVLIERQTPKIAPVQDVQQLDASESSTRDDYYETQFHILRSRSLAARVIKALALDSDARFIGDGSQGLFATLWDRTIALLRSSGKEPEDADADLLGVSPELIGWYLGMLEVSPVHDSRLVKVSFTSRSKSLSAELANRHVQEFISASLDQRRQMAGWAKTFLEEELSKAKGRVVAAEAALNQYRRDKGIIGINGEKSDIASERLDDLNKRYTDAQNERIRLEGDYQLIHSRAPESLPAVVSSLLIQQLKEEAAKVEAQRAELEEKFLPGYPALIEARAREKQVTARLRAEVQKIVDGVESAFLSAEHRERELAQKLEAQRQTVLDQKDVGADYATLNRDTETARSLYANLLQRLKDVDVAEAVKITNISIVDPATAPRFASSPRRGLNLLLATVLGSVLGIAAAFFLDALDNTVKSSEDLTRCFGLPVLGMVPSFEQRRVAYGAYGYGGAALRAAASRVLSSGGNGKPSADTPAAKPTGSGANGNGATLPSTELLVSKHPMSLIAEAYRTIRTAILLSSADVPPQVILFTSGNAAEGKTVTAVNEALALAQSGGRVLLIDADIRKPRLHELFDLLNGAGLSTYLTGQSSLESVTHGISLESDFLRLGKPLNGNGNRHGNDNDHGHGDDHRNGHGNGNNGKHYGNGHAHGSLSVIPSGPLPPNPAELLGSRRMRDTLELLRGRFDYVIVDSPPLLPVTDAIVLSSVSDGVVLVVRAEQTRVETVGRAGVRLKQARAKIIGAVLNDVDARDGDYGEYYEYYGSNVRRGTGAET